jgi:hypothetical protein
MVLIKINRKLFLIITVCLLILAMTLCGYAYKQNKELMEKYTVLLTEHKLLQYNAQKIDRSHLDAVLSQYIKNRIFQGQENDVFKLEAHRILGMESVDVYGNMLVYLYTYCNEYAKATHEMLPMSEGSRLVVMQTEKNQKGYRVLKHKEYKTLAEAAAGSGFPREYVEKVREGQLYIKAQLAADIEEQLDGLMKAGQRIIH